MRRAADLVDPLRARPDWRELAAASVEANPLLAPAFLGAALDHFAPPSVRLALAHDSDGRLTALAPVRPVRIGRMIPATALWTHPYAPRGVPLLDATEPVAAAAALLDAMGAAGSDLLVFPHLPLEGAAAEALRAAAADAGRPVVTLRRAARAMLERDAVPDGDVRSLLPGRRRKDYQRQLRQLAALGEVRIAAVGGGEALPAIEAFLALEAAGWKGTGGTALRSRPRTAAFARAALATGLIDGTAVLLGLWLDAQPLAMLACWRIGDTAVTWKIAYDERFARFSPGVQLMLAAPPLLFAGPAIQRIDSLAVPGHPMIEPLWPGRMRLGSLVIGPEGGERRLALAARLDAIEAAAKARLRPLLKSRARRRPDAPAAAS
ncbi:GNAT family N-acetyltransferase [Prosthecomicrobium pneumaticum]|uniref:CelD/BcsL family acetyltransferase involved in cellulose biosynthesis n=1 Tax=Prosthecomicrobium pneumaticum TaxID=81895 RepID=A0A7W9CV16_9HYPH|nr:GNAT family N-acetyltransferase [Prosthecomicrobium pneumaticum]MBB5752407.1 CelD/BcsL family acetyltransferase involved in cellulose biosynthesis [Prosthecomicrobium pneumaticum]